jgi:trimethylamine--corrinoid protein Co-methyltransferase
MRLLSEVGMEVASPEVREILKRAGCECEGIRVRFPIDLVRESINLAPESFEIEGLNPDKKVRIGDGNSHIQPMVGRLHILERSGNRRRTGLQDVRNIVAICEALPAYDILHGGAVMPDIEGVPAGLAHVAGFVETVRQTGKPFKGSCRGKQVAEDCLRLAEAVREGTGNAFSLHTTCNLVSPLQMAAHMSEGALSYVRKGWPVDFASEPQMGATSPVTLAATASLVIAESLAGLVLAQVVNPGTPVFVGTVGAAMDMRHATIALGGIEAALLNAAHAQMAAYYGLPSRGSGSNTNAKLLDFQAGYEKMMTLLIPILAGIDMVFYPGTLEHAETVSLESLVLDNTLCEIALHAQAGVRVSEELLSVDLIKQAGPGGVFLNSRQTASEMFTEHLVHGLWDRRKRSDWVADGSPTPVHKANAVIEEILGETRPHLPNEVEAKLFEVVSDIAARENALHLVELLWPRKTR